MNTAPRRQNAFALVVVLMILVIAVVLVVAITLTMRTERLVARNMVNSQQAELTVQSAVANAVSLLARNIPDPTDPTVETTPNPKSWFVNPGRLTIVGAPTPGNPTGRTAIELFTGMAPGGPTGKPDSLKAVNLNAQGSVSQKYPITGANHPMWVSWVNVLEDPSVPPDTNNRLVGRYAFWIDDESTKINFNVARGKPEDVITSYGPAGLPSDWGGGSNRDLGTCLMPTFTLGTSRFSVSHPASINLDLLGSTSALPTVNVTALQNDIGSGANANLLTSPQAIKKYFTVADPDSFFEQQKFNLTPFSRSPEFNVFGKSRIFMGTGTSMDLANGPMYQYPLHAEQPVLFWGKYTSIGNNTSADKGKMRMLREPVVKPIAQYLERDDWPGMVGRKFRWTNDLDDDTYPDRHAPGGKAESDQIAINMVAMGYWGSTSLDDGSFTNRMNNAYHRWAHCSGAYPGFGYPNSNLWRGPLSGRAMMPTNTLPQLNEVVCQVTPLPISAGNTTWRLRFGFSYEFTLPPGYMWQTGSSPKAYISPTSGSSNYRADFDPAFCSIQVSSGGSTRTNSFTPGTAPGGQGGDIPASTPLDGFASKIMSTMYVSTGTVPLPGTSTSNSRATFTGSATVTVKLRMTIDGSQIVPTFVSTAEVPGAIPGMLPPSGVDNDGCLVFTFSISGANSGAKTQSLEISDPRIGNVGSRWQLYTSADGVTMDTLGARNSNAGPSVYGPSSASKFAMWNFKDNSPGLRMASIGMFGFVPTGIQRGIPYDSLRLHKSALGPDELPDWLVLDLVAPSYGAPISYMNSTAGKINLNSKIYPAGNPFFAPPRREAPLKAIFRNMPNGANAATNIADWQDAGGDNSFLYVGDVCQVPGVADDDVTSPPAATDFEREVLIRNLASLFTTQSNTFGIWGAAQAVRKRSSNTLHGEFEHGDVVTSERRFYAVVERYVWPGIDNAPGNAHVSGAGIYSRSAQGRPPGGAPAAIWNSDTVWAAVDGAVAPATQDPGVITGYAPYTSSDNSSADNPFAALMKYKVVYFTYID